ncbi:MAG: AI-2E family transporter [Candidatus Saccharimonadales bacterium]
MLATIDISTSAIFKRLLFVTILLVLAVLAYNSRDAIGVFIMAGFIALAMHGPITKLQTYMPSNNRKLAAMIGFLVVGFFVSVIIALIIPVMATQVRELALQAPGYLQDLSSGDNLIATWMQSLDVVGNFQNFLSNVSSSLTISIDLIINLVNRVVNNIITFLFTIVLSFLMVVEGPDKIRQIKQLMPKQSESTIAVLMPKMYRAVTGFVAGQLIITSIAATTTLILLIVFGVPAPLSLAAVIWVTGLIPLVGNTLGAVIVIAVALSQSIFVGILLSIYYIIYQQIENNVFEPIIQSRTIQMTPLYVIVSAIIGVFAAGFIGALIAIPIGASIKIVFDYFTESSEDRVTASEEQTTPEN